MTSPSLSGELPGELSAEAVIARLGMTPLVGEGGWWVRTHYDACSSAIYYLLRAGECSLLHRLVAPEIYHWYSGSPLCLLLLHPDGSWHEPVLGPDLAAGEAPQLVVPAGVWQGSTPLGAYALVGTTMAPRYEDDAFVLGSRAELLAGWPAPAERIVALTPAPV